MSETLTKVVVIAIFVAAMIFFWKYMEKLQKDNERLLKNMQQELLESNSKVLELTKKEFKSYTSDTLLQQLMDSLKLKYKNIGGVIKHKYDYTYDTTIYIVVDTIQKIAIKKFGVKFNSCIGAYGYVTDSTITFDSIPIHYDATTVYYWKRPKQFWFVKYGKKQYFADTKNNCTGESRVEQITIVK